MATVTTRDPYLISLYFQQEKGDPDYGSCLWAIFNFDLDRYEMTITSDCGSYAYGWTPTPNSESFMHLMARLDSGYLLDKLASRDVVNTEETFEAVKDLMNSWGVDLEEFDMEEIKNCCNLDSEREVHDALEKKFCGTSMEDCDDYDLWCCIQMDFTANAKKIVQVFIDYIKPKCKEISDNEADVNSGGRHMSLYNMICGFNPACVLIMPMLGRKQDDYPRFRDCFVTKDNHIAIYTRVGGGNRGCGYGEEELYKDPNFITTYDDDFDSTYATYEFKVPEQWKDDFDKIMDNKLSEVSDAYVKQVKSIFPKLDESGLIDTLFGRNMDEEESNP